MKMKNKKEEQKQKKQDAKKVLENAKKRKRGDVVLERPEAKFSEPKEVLIVCEGKGTEVDYFNEFQRFFKISTITLKVIGTGYNTVSLVEKTEELAQKANYEQIWCVFDKDDFTNENFNNAIKKAESLGFGVAYSNQSFEYWLLLHFIEHNGNPLDRKYYYKMLKQYLIGYSKKNKHISQKFFEILQAIDPKTGKTRQELAIERAKRIIEKWEKEDPSRSNPAQEESSTTVFDLVENLMGFQRK